MQRILTAAVLALFSIAAAAQQFPLKGKPIYLVVTFAAGGAMDLTARSMAAVMSDSFHQVIVENRTGGGGLIGTDYVARAAPDGYTLLMYADVNVIAPAVYPKLNHDPIKDFAPIIQVTNAPTIMVVPPSFPANNVAEFIALAKQRPGQLNFASFGIGSSAHLASEFFMQATGTRMVHVTYKGSAPAIVDLMADRVQVFFDSIPSGLPHVRGGTLKALAVTGPTRSAAAPDLPTIAETIPGFDVTVWQGVAAAAETPPAVIQKLYTEIAKIMALPETQKTLINLGADPVSLSPGQFAAQIARENDKWRKLAKDAKITIE